MREIEDRIRTRRGESNFLGERKLKSPNPYEIRNLPDKSKRIGRIIIPDNPTADELFAADELVHFFGKATGRRIKCVRESQNNSRFPAFFCGRTAFAQRAFPRKVFDREEYFVCGMPGGMVVITGGVPRGTLYGVYEFLEQVAGCRFLAPDYTFIPELQELRLQKGFSLRGKPFFPARAMALGGGIFSDFLVRHRIQDRDFRGGIDPLRGGANSIGSPNYCHTFGHYAALFSDKKPDYFSLVNGYRLNGEKGTLLGQFCLTHPEVRRNMKILLRKMIVSDRLEADKKKYPYPCFYAIQQNDASNFCSCRDCNKLARKVGGQSGLMLDFVNCLADDIAEDYPEVMLVTLAYSYTANPPEGITPRKNVLVQIALLGGEFEQIIPRDCMRSLEDARNDDAKKIYLEWAKRGFHLATWDYGVLYHERVPSPYLFLRESQQNFRLFASLGIKTLFIESGVFLNQRLMMPSFFDLRNYLYFKLSLDPELNVEKVIDDFLVHAYGLAAKAMKQYLNFLETAMKKELRILDDVTEIKRAYLDYGFFLTSERLLTSAEQLVSGNPRQLRQIAKERISIDFAMIALWNTIILEKKFPVTLEQVIGRLRRNQAQITASYTLPGEYREKVKAENLRLIDKLVEPPPALPEKFSRRKVAFDFTCRDFKYLLREQSHSSSIWDDPRAVDGKALRLVKPVDAGNGFEFHLSHPDKCLSASRVIITTAFPSDGYHFYTLKNVALPDDRVKLFAHWSGLNTSANWSNALVPINLHNYIAKNSGEQRYDIVFSVKFTRTPDAVWFDRMLILER